MQVLLMDAILSSMFNWNALGDNHEVRGGVMVTLWQVWSNDDTDVVSGVENGTFSLSQWKWIE